MNENEELIITGYDDYRCICGDEGLYPHTCIKKVDIGDDDETLCTCCQECSDQCALDR